jgi:hypothetical protein
VLVKISLGRWIWTIEFLPFVYSMSSVRAFEAVTTAREVHGAVQHIFSLLYESAFVGISLAALYNLLVGESDWERSLVTDLGLRLGNAGS